MSALVPPPATLIPPLGRGGRATAGAGEGGGRGDGKGDTSPLLHLLGFTQHQVTLPTNSDNIRCILSRVSYATATALTSSQLHSSTAHYYEMAFRLFFSLFSCAPASLSTLCVCSVQVCLNSWHPTLTDTHRRFAAWGALKAVEAATLCFCRGGMPPLLSAPPPLGHPAAAAASTNASPSPLHLQGGAFACHIWGKLACEMVTGVSVAPPSAGGSGRGGGGGGGAGAGGGDPSQGDPRAAAAGLISSIIPVSVRTCLPTYLPTSLPT